MRKRVRPGDPRLAIAYLRVSTEEQQLSPEVQRAACADFARRQGIGIVDWCEDHLTGATELEDRPGLVRALSALQEHRAGVLLILRRDRLARDAAVAALIDRKVRQAGARVVAADGVGNGDTPAEAFLRTVIDGAAEFERALIKERTRAALGAKKARGERVGTVPYGWRAQGVRLEEDPAEQAVIAAARALRSAGRSVPSIMAELAAQGVRSRRGTALQATQVARILRAPAATVPAC